MDGFFETSAKDGTGVKDLFNHIAGQVVKHKQSNRRSASLTANDHLNRMEQSNDKSGKPDKKCPACSIF